MIYIVIPVFNRLHLTIKCLQSLLKQEYREFTIIVIDDGSTDGTSDYLKSHFQEVVLLTGDGNLWWTRATNLGVQKALELSDNEQDFILTLNNDLEVKSDYLQNILNAARKNSKALIGSVSVYIDRPQKIHFAGTRWNSTTAKYKSSISKTLLYHTLASKAVVVATDLLPGRGVLIPINLFKKIGLFDALAFPHYMADEDFSLRACKEEKYTLLVATHAVVYNHVAETGLKMVVKDFGYYKDVFTSIKSPANIKNRWLWAKKHAAIFPPFYFMLDMSRIIKSLLVKQ